MNPTNITPGDVRIARVRNPLEDPASVGKDRPVVVVELTQRGVLVVGLTTQPLYKTTGQPRIGVPDWCAVGLRGPGFLWGSRLTMIDSPDLYKRVGRADLSLVRCIEKNVYLTTRQKQALLLSTTGPIPWSLDKQNSLEPRTHIDTSE